MFEPRVALGDGFPPAAFGLVDLMGGHGGAAFTAWSVGSAAEDSDAEISPDGALDAYAEGFAAGHAAALFEQADAATKDDAALTAIADAVGRMAATHDAATAQTLAAALSRLLATIVGQVDIPPPTLQERAANLLAAVDATATPTALLCHPDDALLIGPSISEISVQPDPKITRGSLRLATSTGWIDDSIADRLAHIEAILAARSAA